VTVGHLLTHTSGVDGDIFTDTGRGDDCVKRYVDLLAGAAQIFPPGAAYSYCNAGFVLLGRIIEVLDGRGWDESLRVRLAEPLGTTATVTLPEEAILHRAAVGHVQSDGRPVRTWALPRSIGPAGLITQRAADLLAFARLHLDDGVTADGTRLLPAELIRSMHVQQVAIPLAADGLTGVGLGFRLHDWNGRTLIGHDGGTVGQLAYLRIDPRARLAVCLLTNSPNAPALSRELLAEVFSSYAGLTAPPALEPGAGLPAGAERHAGRYERAGVRFDVDQRLHLTVSATGDRAAFADDPVHEYDLRPVGESGDRFALQESPGQPWTPLEFAEFADGTPYLFSGGRVTPRAH